MKLRKVETFNELLDIPGIQRFGRLYASRLVAAELGASGQLTIPDEFRAGVVEHGGGDVIVVAAAVCIEIWSPAAWQDHLANHGNEFWEVVAELSRIEEQPISDR
jgi:MraZ protein